MSNIINIEREARMADYAPKKPKAEKKAKKEKDISALEEKLRMSIAIPHSVIENAEALVLACLPEAEITESEAGCDDEERVCISVRFTLMGRDFWWTTSRDFYDYFRKAGKCGTYTDEVSMSVTEWPKGDSVDISCAMKAREEVASYFHLAL